MLRSRILFHKDMRAQHERANKENDCQLISFWDLLVTGVKREMGTGDVTIVSPRNSKDYVIIYKSNSQRRTQHIRRQLW